MGKISKPLKSNKHKKIKFVDPFYNGERKERMHAGKNLPPSKEEEFSRKDKEFIRRTQRAKQLKNKSRRQRKKIMNSWSSDLKLKGAQREFEEVKFQKRKGEMQHEFMRRVDVAAMVAVKESQMENHFKHATDPATEKTQPKVEKQKKMQAEKNLSPSKKEEFSRKDEESVQMTEQAKELEKKSQRQRKKKKKNKWLSNQTMEGAERDFEEVKFKKRKGETQYEFMRRLDIAAMVAIKESQMENNFKHASDPVMEKTRSKMEKGKEKLKMKKQRKKEQKRQRVEDRKDDLEKFKDEVKFGEVVHGPPSLSVRPKRASADAKQPVKSLLLYDVIKNNSGQDSQQTATNTRTSSSSGPPARIPGKCIKRKFLSPAQQLEMDRERQRAIDLYRQLKEEKRLKSKVDSG